MSENAQMVIFRSVFNCLNDASAGVRDSAVDVLSKYFLNGNLNISYLHKGPLTSR